MLSEYFPAGIPANLRNSFDILKKFSRLVQRVPRNYFLNFAGLKKD